MDRGRITEDPPLGAILAGGRSSRFGSPKALGRIGGSTMVEHIVAAHRSALEKTILVTDQPELFRGLGVETIGDYHPGLGPIGGLHAALRCAHARGADGVCCTPCDAPFVHPAFFEALIRVRSGSDAVLPEGASVGRYEPLFGWYSCETLPLVEQCIAERSYALHRLVSRIPSLRVLHATDLPAALDPDLLFLNVNTRDELELARERFAGQPSRQG